MLLLHKTPHQSHIVHVHRKCLRLQAILQMLIVNKLIDRNISELYYDFEGRYAFISLYYGRGFNICVHIFDFLSPE